MPQCSDAATDGRGQVEVLMGGGSNDVLSHNLLKPHYFLDGGFWKTCMHIFIRGVVLHLSPEGSKVI